MLFRSVALPVYQAYRAGGVAGARSFLRGLVDGLRAAMLLTGSRRLADLRRAPVVLGPRLRAWNEVNGPGRTRTRTRR